MFSRSNHHHLSQRSSSVPPPRPLAGTRRPRSPEATPPRDSEEDNNVLPHQESPLTQRSAKRGWLYSPNRLDEHPQVTPDGPPILPATTSPLAGPTPPTDDDFTRLERLLDSVLATATIIHAALPASNILTAHACNVFTAISAIVSPHLSSQTATVRHSSIPTGEPARRSYAQAAGRHTQTSSAHTHKPGASPAGPQKRELRPAKPKCVPSSPSRHSPNRLIVRWPNQPLSIPPDQLEEFREALNTRVGLMRASEQRVIAINMSKSGCVVLHTQSPFSAKNLLEFKESILETLGETVDISQFGRPSFELDVPWHSVVVHDAPSTLLRQSIASC